MGNWNITIQGVGAHNNENYPKDANLMFDAFIKELREAGHYVHHASFTSGSAQIEKDGSMGL